MEPGAQAKVPARRAGTAKQSSLTPLERVLMPHPGPDSTAHFGGFAAIIGAMSAASLAEPSWPVKRVVSSTLLTKTMVYGQARSRWFSRSELALFGRWT